MDIEKAAQSIIQEADRRRQARIKDWKKELVSIYNNFKYDKFNLPFLNSAQIERIANLFLLLYSSSTLDFPSVTPIAELISLLQANGKVNLSYSNDLPSDENTKTLGITHLEDKLILISDNIQQNVIVHNYVVAHELGHLFLHTTKPILDDKKLKIKSILDDDSKFIYNKRNHETVREWMEWQANCFAASLLTPAKTFKKRLQEIQSEFDLSRNMGSIYLDQKYYSKRDFKKVLYHLSKTFNVSERVCEIRLYNLDLINDTMKKEIDGYKIAHILKAFYNTKIDE